MWGLKIKSDHLYLTKELKINKYPRCNFNILINIENRKILSILFHVLFRTYLAQIILNHIKKVNNFDDHHTKITLLFPKQWELKF